MGDNWQGDLLDADTRDDDYPAIAGLTAERDELDPRAVLDEMIAEYERLNDARKLGEQNRIPFERGPVCLVFVADMHLGHIGVNYRRAFEEARIIADTPGMWLVTCGDMVENMILPKLMHARYSGEASPRKEWAMLRYYLSIVGHKLIVSVPGNHDNWVTTLTGIPYFLDVLRQVQPKALYNFANARFVVQVGAAQFPVRVRHRWRYSSKYNATHGIEDMARWDGDFRIGVGAHTHVSGLVREWNYQSRTNLAALCGAYKEFDEYASAGGFPKPNGSTAVAAILNEDDTIIGISNLAKAAELMRLYRGAR